MARRRVVLVVDDQAITRDVVAVMLDQDEVEVHAAHDGETALKQAALLRPDVVLLDVSMPGGLDGFEVCRRLRAEPEPPRVVMLTGHDDAAYRRRAREAGAEAYLVKPFSAADLYAAVEREAARGT